MDEKEVKQIQAGILLFHMKIHYNIEIAIHSYCIGCEIDLYEMTHNKCIEAYIKIVSFISIVTCVTVYYWGRSMETELQESRNYYVTSYRRWVIVFVALAPYICTYTSH